MDSDQSFELLHRLQAEGKTKEEIYSSLLSTGLTVDQIQSLLRDSLDKEEKADSQQHAIRIILIIAAIFVGAGIISFFASNWQEIPRLLKVLIVIFSMLGSYFGGWYFKEKSQMPKTGDAFILLGSIIYGAGIFLIGQMFNIRTNWPDGFMLWMIGSLAVAYATNLKLVYLLAFFVGLIAVISSPISIMAGPQQSAILTSSFVLLISTAILFFTIFYLRNKADQQRLKNL